MDLPYSEPDVDIEDSLASTLNPIHYTFNKHVPWPEGKDNDRSTPDEKENITNTWYPKKGNHYSRTKIIDERNER